MKLLITNIAACSRSGTEVVTAELLMELRRRGHDVVLYSPQCGELAKSLKAKGISVVEQIGQVPFIPDLIHGHHNTCIAAAITRFPDTPCLMVCHDYDVYHDLPFVHPSIYRYVAVDALCLRRLKEHGIPEERSLIINNRVDLDAYRPKSVIREKPAKALILSKGSAHEELVQEACLRHGIQLDRLGPAFGNEVDNLHDLLPEYDLVFATARMALEAATCGCGVIVMDHRGLAGALNTANWSEWYHWNLGRGILSHPVNAKTIEDAFQSLDWANLDALTSLVRESAGLAEGVDQFESLYADILEESKMPSENRPPFGGAPDFATFLEDYLPGYNTSRPSHDVFRFLTDEKTTPEMEMLRQLQDSFDRRIAQLEEQLKLEESTPRESSAIPSES